jgi:hypothetical protein
MNTARAFRHARKVAGTRAPVDPVEAGKESGCKAPARSVASRQLCASLVVAVAALILGASEATAKLTPAQKCAAAKLTAAAKKVNAKVKCHVKTKLAAEPDPSCLQNAEEKFTKAFAKAEKPSACLVTGDAATIEDKVDAFVTTLVQALQPPLPSTPPVLKCAVAKLTAARKNVLRKTRCHVKNLPLPNDSLLSACFSIAEDKFGRAVAKAEASGACATSGDAATIAAAVDTFVGDVGQPLVPTTSTPTFPTPAGAPITRTPTPIQSPAPTTGQCGNNIQDAGEECDGSGSAGDDRWCPGWCLSDCTCSNSCDTTDKIVVTCSKGTKVFVVPRRRHVLFYPVYLRHPAFPARGL